METVGRTSAAVDVTPSDGLSSRSGSYVPFGLIVLTFAATTLWLSAKLNLYIDELYSLHTTSHGFSYALEQALGFEQQPPLFFLLLTAWRTLDGGDYFARLFSIGCCVATLFVGWGFGRRHFRTLPNWLAPLALAINPFFLWVALDIRVYALIVLLSTLLVTLFFRAFGSERPSVPYTGAFTIVAILGLYTQYFIGSLLLGFAVALLFGRKWRGVIAFGISMFVVALAFVPLVIGSLGRELREETAIQIVPPLVLAVHMIGSTLSFVYPHTWVDDISKTFNILYLGIVLFTLAFVLRERRRPGFVVPALAAVVATMVAFFLCVILGVQAPLEMPRHVSALFVPALLLALGSFAAIENAANRRRVALAYAICLVIFSAADDVNTYHSPLSNSGDWRRVGDFLNAHVEASEPIVVFDTEGALGVRHYYRGTSRIIPLPHEQSFTVFDRRDFALGSTSRLARAFPEASPVTGRTWLVFGITACTMVEIGDSCSLLKSFVARHFSVLLERRFNGTIVQELQSKAQAHDLAPITIHTARTE